ncbi:MAG: hypothetical protein AAFN77_23885 [Planctomycetota bacterium]
MSQKTSLTGTISLNETYTLAEFKQRMGLTDTAMRALRRNGLPISRVGKRAFVVGAIAVQFLIEAGMKINESESDQDSSQVSGSALDLPTDREGETEISQDKRSA